MLLVALAIAFLLFVGLAPPLHGAPGANPDEVAAVAPTVPAAPASRTPMPASAQGTLAHDEIGGDDVALVTGYDLHIGNAHPLDIASDGTLYAVAWIDVDGSTSRLNVYRSTDHGHVWYLWGTIGGTPNVRYDNPVVRVAEGDADRVFVAYTRHAPGEDAEIRVSYSSFSAYALWSETVVLSQAGVDFDRLSLDADDASYSGYTLYLAAEGVDGDGDDVWFTRSTDFGSTWSAGYRIASMSIATRGYRLPEVRYGFGGMVHCAWTFFDDTGALDWAIRYRRALNRAASGLGDWQTTQYLTPNNDGIGQNSPTLAASTVNNWMLLAWDNMDSGPGYDGTGLWGNSTAGASWDPALVDSLPFIYEFGLQRAPGLSDFVAAGAYGEGRFGIMRAPSNAPLSWGPFQELTDRKYDDFILSTLKYSIALDPSMGDRAGLMWTRVGEGLGADTLFFDAEWRRDPGWPNLDPGMPVALPAGVISPPAICELDGDPQSEIVFGDSLGFVRVHNHDGTVVPGWPHSMAGIANDSPVAVGDLDGDGRNEVVAGSANGWVYAWHHDGTPVAGWPVNAAAGPAAYVSLGPLLPESPLQVVVTCGNTIRVLLANGTLAPGWPSNKAASFTAPAAIGDVDADGTFEIVSVFGAYLNVSSPTGATEHWRNLLAAGRQFTNGPTLADLDLDGDLEIVTPTRQGDIYVSHHDGTDMAGWPWSDGSGCPISSVALANMYAGSEPELAFTIEETASPHVQCLDHHAASYLNWPRHPHGMDFMRAMPVIDPVCDPPTYFWTTFIGSPDGWGYAWNNAGFMLPGWSLELPGACRVSPATGDVDQDGRLEIVFTTFDPARLVVYDLGAPLWRDLTNTPQWWPMYGYNAERMSCLECEPYAVTGVPRPDGAPERLWLEAPRPNPSSGALALRFTLPARAPVRLEVLDVAGRVVRMLLRSEFDAGVHDATWDGRDAAGGRAPAGVYFVRLAVAGASPQVRRVALVP